MAEGTVTTEANLAARTGVRRSRTFPAETLLARAEEALERGTRWLLSQQAHEGYWWGELEADTTLESDYILYHFVLGRMDSPKIQKLANYIRGKQLPSGGWNICEGEPAELNATVKAYFALKLAGDAPNASHMARARECVHRLGGLETTNSYTRFYLAMVGALGWELVPAIPPELMLLPKWFFVNVYEMSSWTRGILVPVAIVYALKPGWKVPDSARIDELFANPAQKGIAFRRSKQLFSWRNFFLATDRAMKFYESWKWKPLRRRALAAAKGWLLEHVERSDGLGTIYPAMVNSIFALLALGYSSDDALTAREIEFLERYEIAEEDSLHVQPCISPVWDTAIAMVSLEEAGVEPTHRALVKAAEWLLEHQILGPGDWQVKDRTGEPGGWAFEFRNDFYPDVDDTAFVLMALGGVDYPNRARLKESVRRGVRWLLSMQNRDGGWGAFDKDNDLKLLTCVPFADHNAMLDPSTADVTARVLECLGRCDWPASHPAVARGLNFMTGDQKSDGSWYGRWGVNYIYGTSGVLRALETFGLSRTEDCRRALDWLRSVQHADGGFGETVASYADERAKGKGNSTASQTAWAIIALLAGGGPEGPAVERAVEYLARTQNPDGTWDEPEFTGTGFPCVFYLKYHLYRNSFPVYALARYRNMKAGAREYPALRMGPEAIENHEANRGYR
ncbi:MAG: squalene--hopene cyclase [Candidatus Acidiferrales bacterium]